MEFSHHLSVAPIYSSIASSAVLRTSHLCCIISFRLITGGAKEAPELVAEAAAAIRRSIAGLDLSGVGGGGRAAEGVEGAARKAAGGANRRWMGRATDRSATRLAPRVANGKGKKAEAAAAGVKVTAEQSPMTAYSTGGTLEAAAAAALAFAPAAAEVSAASGADGAAAARREALFERLHRQRAEALLAAARTSLSRLKVRTSHKLSMRGLGFMCERSTSDDEQGRFLLEALYFNILRPSLRKSSCSHAPVRSHHPHVLPPPPEPRPGSGST